MSHHPPLDYVRAALYDAAFVLGALKDAALDLVRRLGA